MEPKIKPAAEPDESDELVRLMYGRPLVSPAQDAALTLGISESLLWAKCSEGSDGFDPKFPQPIREYAGTKRTVWVTVELLLFVQQQSLKRFADEVAKTEAKVRDLAARSGGKRRVRE